MKSNALCRKDLGFTLIELMFAAGVLAMGLGMLFGSLISMNLMVQVAEGKTKATAYMSSVLEQVRETPRSTLFTFSPVAAPQCPGYAMRVVLDAVNTDGSTVRLPLANAAAGSALPSPLVIRATVAYTTPRGQEFSMTSTTLNGG
ncbi:MAG: hypothetical protein HGB35_07825 [Geobacteraceae bacterium]|nr:hypothetical protein [Geobacteraceae bacterium]